MLGLIIRKLIVTGQVYFLFGKLKRYKGVQSKVVASAIIFFAKFGNEEFKIIELDEIIKTSYNACNY